MSKPHTSKKSTPKAKNPTAAMSLQAKVTAASKHVVAKAKKTTKRQRMIAAPLMVAAVVGIAFAMFQITGVAGSPEHGGDHDHHAGHTQYQQELLGQVDNVTGAPRDGRDPANQRQTSLEEAANSPTLTGQRKDSVASGVSGGGSVSGASDDNGDYLNNSGCYYNYGNGGQCLAAHVAVNGKTTCKDVRGHGGFPNGIVVSGTDHFKLDTNKNGTACDAGDKA